MVKLLSQIAGIDKTVTREILGNVDPISRTVFYVLTVFALCSFVHGLWSRWVLWKQGRRTDASPCSLPLGVIVSRVVGRILLQRRVRRQRKAAGRAHVLLFAGFGILFIGTILIAIEHYSAAAIGRSPLDPIFHKGLYFVIYEFVLDTAGLALLAGCLWFFNRRFKSDSSMAHVRSDYVVLGLLVSLVITGYVAEGLRITLEDTPLPGFSYVGLLFAWPLQWWGVTSENAAPIHLTLWWLHVVLALGLIALFPHTRLLHSLAGAINLACSEQTLGVMQPISIEQVEETGLVGAEKFTDFTRWQLLSLDACVSCGRCEELCPADQAGKVLSPRDVVQGLRCVMELGNVPLNNGISNDAAWACTTCHACVETCPLGVDPLEFITDVRRNLVAEGKLKGPPGQALQKMQRSGNPWGLPADERLTWSEGLDVPLVNDVEDFEIVYWVGCAAAYDRRIQKVARAVVQLLQAAKVKFVVLGPEERCTGESARRMGDEFLFQELAANNISTFSKYPIKKIVTHCPHCLNSFKHDYPQFYEEFGGGDDFHFEAVHHTQFLSELLAAGRLAIPENAQGGNAVAALLTYHDPCYLARVNGITESPRELIQLTLPEESVVELSRCGENTACCGAGGGRMWFDDEAVERTGSGRVDEVIESAAKTLAVACPFCLTMMNDGLAAREAAVEVRDVAELLLEALGTAS
ncbi:MAG: 4Fe-4S dicluster domain-containing protein [Planctomycetaceae bacterium]|nr:4Fe-4S dicluster domain-containing protein [Planctomycetaceae bacterium]MBT5597734.1 4Fe-4S dicluster domain-containing protein [Planctomycetaceae bacterium]MBT7253623.1 4Fe-4S dicluster domain-containing protein [Planctomycetaceae bacterium]